MQVLIILILIYLLLVIQAQLGFAFCPDLLLVAVIVLSLKRRPSGALGYAFLSGFLQDVLLSTSFFNTLSKTLTVAFANLLKGYLVFERRTIALILVLILSPLAIFMNSIWALFFSGTKIHIFAVMLSALVVTLLNLLLTPVILYIFDRFVGD